MNPSGSPFDQMPPSKEISRNSLAAVGFIAITIGLINVYLNLRELNQ